MRNYRPKSGEYALPHPVYHHTLWLIKGYFYFKERMNDIILATPDHDGSPKGNEISDPTAAKAVKVKQYARIVRIIDEEKENIQEEYRTGVWRSIMYGERYPDTADRRTYSRYKSRFVYNVAKRLGYY